jgi:Protein of unknown function (DUF3489)
MSRTTKSSSSSKRAAPAKSPKPSTAKPQAAARRQQSSQTTPKNRIKSVQKPPTSKIAKSPRPTKQSRLIELLLRPTGAKLTDLIDATGWQAHSVRGVISGILRKKLGLIIESQTNAHGIRVYRINPAAGAAK